MRYLLDTNVVSGLRVRGRNPALEAWASSVPIADQYVTAFTISELELGVAAKERNDPDQGRVLRRWFEDRVSCGGTRTRHVSRPEHSPMDDALIAAIAQAENMTVVTRNLRHFEPLGVPCLDPWQTSA